VEEQPADRHVIKRRCRKEAVVRLLLQSYIHVLPMLHRLARSQPTQFTPSPLPYMLNTFPLLTSFIQFGGLPLPLTVRTARPPCSSAPSAISTSNNRTDTHGSLLRPGVSLTIITCLRCATPLHAHHPCHDRPIPANGWYTKMQSIQRFTIVPCPLRHRERPVANSHSPLSLPPPHPVQPRQPQRLDVTVNRTALLSFIPGATEN